MPIRMEDPLAELPGYILRRASIATMTRLHGHLAPFELRATEASVILLIGAHEGVTQSDVGRLLGIKRANMAPLTAKLEGRGLLVRKQINGRSQGLFLTPAGQALLGKVRSAISRHEQETLARVPEHLRQHVIPILASIWGGEGEAG